MGVFLLGVLLQHFAPGLHTSGWQMLVWGFFISTVAVYHGTYTINSLSHVFGRQRYKTGDASRNNPWLALITLGEGWHNNHHHYPASVRQGFYWWEFDITFYMLKLMSYLGVIWDLKPVPLGDARGRRQAPLSRARAADRRRTMIRRCAPLRPETLAELKTAAGDGGWLDFAQRSVRLHRRLSAPVPGRHSARAPAAQRR